MSGIVRSSTVFVGNIPYDATEEDLREILGKVGAIDSFRLVYDKDTRQPRGYAFCDFCDPETAVRAVKELSAAECNGRGLRLDLADNALRGGGGKGGGPPPGPPGGSPFQLALAGPSPALSRPSLPPSFPSGPAAPPPGPSPVGPPISGGGGPSGRPSGPPGAPARPDTNASPEDVIAEVDAHAEIAQAVAAMPQAQLQLCLGTMQRLATEAPDQTRTFLHDNPQLCYALLHAQLLLGLTLEKPMPASEEEMQRLAAEAMARYMQPPPGARPPHMAGVAAPPFGMVMPPMACMGMAMHGMTMVPGPGQVAAPMMPGFAHIQAGGIFPP